MFRRFVVLAMLLGLTACAAPLEVGSITEIKSHTGSRSIDVHEPRRKAGQASLPEFAGDQLLEVRTYVQKDGEPQMEVAGAACALSAADFSATMQSPAKVRVPLYRGQSSVLAVSCEMPGYQKRMVTVNPIDVMREKRLSSGAGSGVIGLVAVAAIDAMSDNSKNEWRYPLARVVLEPVAQKSAQAN